MEKPLTDLSEFCIDLFADGKMDREDARILRYFRGHGTAGHKIIARDLSLPPEKVRYRLQRLRLLLRPLVS